MRKEKSLKKLVEMMERFRHGEPCSEKDWDMKILPRAIREVLKDHGLDNQFNPENPINMDMELADRYYEAALVLLEKIGIFNPDTETRVRFSRQEIIDSLNAATDSLEIGLGKDRVVLKARRPEDDAAPLYCASLAIQTDEELYIPLVHGMIANPNVNILQGPSIDTVYGAPVFAGSPYETVAGFLETEMRREAQLRAGRENMANMSIASATTEYGHIAFGAETSVDNPSISMSLQPAELKTCKANFHKVATGMGYKGIIRAGNATMLGGYSGPPEGAALSNIAAHLYQPLVNQADIGAATIYNIRNTSSVGRPTLWANSVATQAVSRNTHMLFEKIMNQLAGPSTKEILYTNAVGTIALAASGMSYQIGPRSAGGRFKSHISPLEAWFSADVNAACAGLSLEKANEMVLKLLPKYEDNIADLPGGQNFRDCFDVSTLKPTAAWQSIYEEVVEEMNSIGLNIDMFSM